jgi:hypothetical protein
MSRRADQPPPVGFPPEMVRGTVFAGANGRADMANATDRPHPVPPERSEENNEIFADGCDAPIRGSRAGDVKWV